MDPELAWQAPQGVVAALTIGAPHPTAARRPLHARRSWPCRGRYAPSRRGPRARDLSQQATLKPRSKHPKAGAPYPDFHSRGATRYRPYGGAAESRIVSGQIPISSTLGVSSPRPLGRRGGQRCRHHDRHHCSSCRGRRLRRTGDHDRAFLSGGVHRQRDQTEADCRGTRRPTGKESQVR